MTYAVSVVDSALGGNTADGGCRKSLRVHDEQWTILVSRVLGVHVVKGLLQSVQSCRALDDASFKRICESAIGSAARAVQSQKSSRYANV